MTNSFWSNLIQFRQLHWVALLFVLLYAWWTLRILSRHPRRLIYPALLVFIASTALYWLAYHETGISSFFASLSMAVFSALDLFVFRMNTTVAIASDFFYSSPGRPELQGQQHPPRLVLKPCIPNTCWSRTQRRRA